MSRTLPPLDLHAHIELGIAPRQLEQLGAVVFAATRSADEFERTTHRADRVTVWGLGCHPAVASAQAEFDDERFAELMRNTPFLGEVGLDGAARIDMETQVRIFRSILARAARTPRIVSVHSKRATSRVLDLVEESQASGIVLHWWLGSESETRRAVRLGCLFSVNRSMDCVRLCHAGVPLDRLLPETDHPAGNRRGSGLKQPGWTLDVEGAVADAYALTPEDVRTRFWHTLAGLARSFYLDDLFPRPVRAMLEAARQQAIVPPEGQA
ncbi:TatD family hydrolase [Saccharomonospora piscinae]|uniref:TatD family hydrolase n=1 Tax=Saccharomonospora piscinae TaxID=687388 RepID=UPI000467AC0D|nr:TatD family hydrolase [Saccharomonospora piscinae]